MRRKTVSGIMLTLLLTGMLILTFNIQSVKSDWTWTETIYIRADGSVYPDTAPISTVDNITYTLTDNIVGDVPDYRSAIIVKRDNIVVDGAGYTVQGIGARESKGIDLSNRGNVTIKNVEIEAFHYGIWLSFSSNNRIYVNKITNSYRGIWLHSSLNNFISGNYIKLSTQPTPDDIGQGVGILFSSSNNTISGNSVENTFVGIQLQSFSNYNIVSGNNVKNNYYGIAVSVSSNYNNVSANTITSGRSGINLECCSNNTVYGNNITENVSNGIVLYPQALNNVLYENHIVNNNRGITLWEASYNSIYNNNFINNNQQVYIITSSHANFWDNGYPSGGNYWSDYTGVDVKSGPNQDQPSSDGIGDTPYIIGANNTDHYPLMYPWGTPPPPSYTLTIYSSPTGVTFIVDGVSRTTPWSGTYSEGASVSLVMPRSHDGYVWCHWLEDGDTNRTKTAIMNTNITLTGVFTFVPPSATVDIDPNTLNLKSRGRWITCYIELPEGYNASDINRTTLLLNDTIPVDPFWVDKPLESVVGDYDDDGNPDLMVKFSRAAVIEYLLGQNITYGKVTLTVIGELYDGTSFEGSDMIRVKMPSDVNSSCDECVDNYKLVVPEFPSFLILPLFMIATLLAVIVYKRKRLCNIRFSLKQTIKIS